jgi:hypothetical protein
MGWFCTSVGTVSYIATNWAGISDNNNLKLLYYIKKIILLYNSVDSVPYYLWK